MASPTYQAIGTIAGATTSVSPAWPAHVANDIGVLIVETTGGQTASLATPAGFTLLDTISTGTGVAGTKLSVFWCRATSSAMTAPTTNSPGNHAIAIIFTLRGCVTTGNPFDVTDKAVVNGGTATTTLTFPAVTPTVTDTLIVNIGSRDTDSAGAHLGTPSNPSLTTTKRYDAGNISGNGGGFGIITGPKTNLTTSGVTSVTSSSAIWVGMTLAFKSTTSVTPDPFTTDQTAFRFYEDGSESGSTAIDAQDTNITRTVNSDSNLALRTRIQETGADTDGLSTDDYQLQYSYNSSYYALIDTHIIDSYPDTNFSFNASLNDTVKGLFQSFTGSGLKAGSAMWRVAKVAAPTGNAYAKIYAHSGTFGSSGLPTGSALATSDPYDVSTISGVTGLITFTFSGSNQITLTAGTNYVLSIEYTNGDSTNRLGVSGDFTSPSHAGNGGYNNGSIWIAESNDYIFSLAGVPVVNPFASASLTDGGATTNRLGSGTGSFVAGKVSEDGLVDDVQITANNYTELLYSLTVVESQVSNGDTIDFKVLRNGAALDAYTVTPRITVSKSGGGGGFVNKTDFFQFF